MPDARAPLYLVAGGRGADRPRGPDPLIREVVRRTGIARPRVAYVGAASGDNAAFRLWIAGILGKAGAGAVTLAPLCGKRGDPDKAKAVLEASDLVFISGGDVENGMRVLEETGMMPFLRRLFRAGTPFFGVSAGSIMLARKWVRWSDPSDDSSARLFPCMGFGPVLCDTHGEAEGWEELRALLALTPAGTVGYGIVSGAAIVIEPDGSVRALSGEVHRFRKRAGGVAQVKSLFPGSGGDQPLIASP